MPTLACDASCDYCFQERRETTMSAELLGLVLRRIREFTAEMGTRKLVLYWLGGEVFTLPAALVGEALEQTRELFAGSGTEVEHHLQSNLLSYGPRWGGIVAEHFRGSISSSMDFPNLHRRTRSLSPEQYTAQWIERKREAEADGLSVVVVSVPNAGTLREGPEAFHRFFAEVARTRSVQVNLPFPGAGDRFPVDLDTDSLSAFMVGLCRVWRANGRYLNLSPFAALENRMRGDGRGILCAFTYDCAQEFVAIGPDGQLAQCDCLLSGMSGLEYGSLVDAPIAELLASPNRERFLSRPIRVFQGEECGSCMHWRICHAGCPVRAYAFTGKLDTRDHYCTLYKALFTEIAEGV